ncbi:MAG: hypothetical protein J0H36_09385 [Hyphomicrobium denitrificans]|nr:hypothetical protein [Hyphomicrobium denitrificans]MBN9354471.1 hypothetical protein [Hyphomicrobium denitrificans]
MRRGTWHQCGHNSQILVAELMEAGLGVGAIISPKDLALDKAKEYAAQYRGLGKGVLFDPQFYEPEFAAGKLGTYPTAAFRQSIGALGALQPSVMTGLAQALETENRELGCDAVIAPAIPYEAARPDIVGLNARLFDAAKAAGDAIGIPTYATIVLGHSTTTLDVAQAILSGATALNADGWYYAFEFDAQQRLPTDIEAVYRYGTAGLTLACTGKPVLHACAGPLANISYGAGARGAGIGIWQNLWGFTRSKFQPATAQGGGGDAPPRYFSAPLWGTIVHPDETLQLPSGLHARVMQHSPYSQNLTPGVPWSKREASKHLVHVIATATEPLAQSADARQAMSAAIATLVAANALHGAIRSTGVQLRDSTDTYQSAWAAAGTRLLANNTDDYDWLELSGGP